MKKTTKMAAILVAAIFYSPYVVNAGPMLGSGWTIIAQEDNVGSNGYVGPGYGGQAFDAEYLFFQQNGDVISVGLQTGFDLTDGSQDYAGKRYYSGDLALSFDGDTTSGLKYEYAIDFGFLTKDYDNNNVGGGGTGTDTAGIYRVNTWNNNLVNSFEAISSPFAMSSGINKNDPDFLLNNAVQTGTSYLRTASFSLSSLELEPGPYYLNAHWTMSCGNDVLNGSTPIAPVPESGTLLLTVLGLCGLAFYRKRNFNT